MTSKVRLVNSYGLYEEYKQLSVSAMALVKRHGLQGLCFQLFCVKKVINISTKHTQLQHVTMLCAKTNYW